MPSRNGKRPASKTTPVRPAPKERPFNGATATRGLRKPEPATAANPQRTPALSKRRLKDNPYPGLDPLTIPQPQNYAPPDTPLDSIVTPDRVYIFKISRFSAIRNLSPEMLSRQIDEWNAGTLRAFALTMQAVEDRDDTLKSVAPKRKKAISRRALTYEIVDVPGASKEDSERHRAVLKYFYDNLTATSAIDTNERRGFSLLILQMMDAIGKRYALHEILWQPTQDIIPESGTNGLTAQFNFVPLWFFENRTGRLRFLPHDFAYNGIDLEDGAWLITVADGIMEACCVAFMFKHLPLKDWLIYSERFGSPAAVVRTKGYKGSPQWDAAIEAAKDIGAGFSAVMSFEDELEKVEFATSASNDVYEKLVDRMSRAMTALWRGSDLSTMSARSSSSGGGQGASVQEEENLILESDDAALISETLNIQLDRMIIQYHFGEGVKPAAYVKISVPPKQDVAKDIQIDTFLINGGALLTVQSVMERYGRAMAEGDQTGGPFMKPAIGAKGQQQGGADNEPPGAADASNEAQAVRRGLIANAQQLFTRDTLQSIYPLVDRVLGVLELPDDAFDHGLALLVRDIPGIVKDINKNPANKTALENAMTAGLFNGVITSAVERARHDA